MKFIGYSRQALHEIGVTAHLEAITEMTSRKAEEIAAGTNDQFTVPYIDADHAVLKAVAAMIEANNQLVSEQLRRLGYLKDSE